MCKREKERKEERDDAGVNKIGREGGKKKWCGLSEDEKTLQEPLDRNPCRNPRQEKGGGGQVKSCQMRERGRATWSPPDAILL